MHAINFEPLRRLATDADRIWQRYLAIARTHHAAAMDLQGDAQAMFQNKCSVLDLQLQPEIEKNWGNLVWRLQKKLENWLVTSGVAITPDYGSIFALAVTSFRDSKVRELDDYYLALIDEATAAPGFAPRMDQLIATLSPERLEAAHRAEIYAGLRKPLVHTWNDRLIAPTPAPGGVHLELSLYQRYSEWCLSEGSGKEYIGFFDRLAQLNERESADLSVTKPVVMRATRQIHDAMRGYSSRDRIDLGEDANLVLFKDKACLYLSTRAFEAIQLFMADHEAQHKAAA